MEKILFLDIDGVLNNHKWNEEAKSNTILPRCVGQLNRIVREVDPYVVLSSAWRYMITEGAMTLSGFHHMLQTHGVTKAMRLKAYLPKDDYHFYRGKAIRNYLDLWIGNKYQYCVLDDGYRCADGSYDDFEIPQYHPTNHVMVDGNLGLTVIEADKVIRMLNQ